MKPKFVIYNTRQLPPKRPMKGGPGSEPKYPFAVLNVGQSFVIPAEASPKKRTMYVYASTLGRRQGKKFSCNSDKTGNIEVTRVA